MINLVNLEIKRNAAEAKAAVYEFQVQAIPSTVVISTEEAYVAQREEAVAPTQTRTQ